MNFRVRAAAIILNDKQQILSHRVSSSLNKSSVEGFFVLEQVKVYYGIPLALGYAHLCQTDIEKGLLRHPYPNWVSIY